jgi:hypothetical protein
MISENKPGTRLITQNMLSSAALYEICDTLSWDSIQDLAAFIDLFCLYDQVVVLGRGADAAYHNWQSDFLGMLRDHSFVKIDHPKPNIIENVTGSATKHLMTFLGEGKAEQFESLLKFVLSTDEAFYGLNYMPDGGEEIDIGKLWLQTAPTQADLIKQLMQEQNFSRGTTFLVRTFLYLAYAEVTETAFTPDAVRCPPLEIVLNSEEQFRGKLLSELKSSFEELPGSKKLLKRMSPFASIVFERAGKKRENICKEMEKLRGELESDRKELRKLEDKALYEDNKQAIKSQEKWNAMANELVLSYKSTALEVIVKHISPFHKALGDVTDKPSSPGKWFEIIGLPVHIKKVLETRMTTVNLHRLLLKGTKGAGTLRMSIENLFGPVQD